jgi:transposase-like protein
MGEHPRKADGRWVFSTEFKRATVQRIVTGEKTVAELTRELDVAPSVIGSWKRFAEAGATTAVQASNDVVPANQRREAYAKIRKLERALGGKIMEVEIFRERESRPEATPLRPERCGDAHILRHGHGTDVDQDARTGTAPAHKDP